jgi:hypothetical protein
VDAPEKFSGRGTEGLGGGFNIGPRTIREGWEMGDGEGRIFETGDKD